MMIIYDEWIKIIEFFLMYIIRLYRLNIIRDNKEV